jgi:hypothetical protein
MTLADSGRISQATLLLTTERNNSLDPATNTKQTISLSLNVCYLLTQQYLVSPLSTSRSTRLLISNNNPTIMGHSLPKNCTTLGIRPDPPLIQQLRTIPPPTLKYSIIQLPQVRGTPYRIPSCRTTRVFPQVAAPLPSFYLVKVSPRKFTHPFVEAHVVGLASQKRDKKVTAQQISVTIILITSNSLIIQ